MNRWVTGKVPVPRRKRPGIAKLCNKKEEEIWVPDLSAAAPPRAPLGNAAVGWRVDAIRFGKRVTDLQAQLRLSDAELTRRAGLRPAAGEAEGELDAIKRGLTRNPVPLELADRLAKALKYSRAALLGAEAEPVHRLSSMLYRRADKLREEADALEADAKAAEQLEDEPARRGRTG